ncbi:MAG: universal stress protein [Halobacteriota archaeon]
MPVANPSIERVLVLEDGEPGTGPVSQQAAILAAGVNATLHLLAVVDPGAVKQYFGPGTIGDIDDAERRLIEEANDLAAVTGVDIEATVLRGTPSEVVPTYLAAESIDLFAVDRAAFEDRSLLGRWRLADRLEEIDDGVSVLLVGTGSTTTDTEPSND